MPPRRDATNRKAKNPATRKRSATSAPSSNIRHDSGSDDAQENYARKRQRRDSNHTDDAVDEREPLAEKDKLAVAEPLSDASNVVAPPPTSGQPLALASNHPWPAGQSSELQRNRANASMVRTIVVE